MIDKYLAAVMGALQGVLSLLTKLALPIAIGVAALVIAATLALIWGRERWPAANGRRLLGGALGYGALILVLVVGWAGLGLTRNVAQQNITWQENAQATRKPTPDAPPVYQYGPAVAELSEHTYTRTLTVPPYFLDRLGTDGVGVLAPYLTDPSAENVIRLRDTFRRSGRNVVFTRESTLLDETPIPFSDSQVKVNFKRLSGRAYDVDFDGVYTFANARKAARTVHFLFNLPQAGTIRDLSVTVDNQAVTEPTDSGRGKSDTYEWKGEMAPGQQRVARVHYRVTGAQFWRYDLGSQRRRVQQFGLDVAGAGDVNFVRGSLQPTTDDKTGLNWTLSNVVTAQQIALSFPPDNLGKQLYLQALSALPASLVLFAIGALCVGLWFEGAPAVARLLAATVLFALGLGAATVAAIYLGFTLGLLIAPLAGAALASLVLGRRSLLVGIPAALLPATFLSAQNSGLLILVLVLCTLGALVIVGRRTPKIVESPNATPGEN